MSNDSKPKNEGDTVQNSYILTFYQEVQNLTHWFAQYQNLLTEFQAKYGEDLKRMDEGDKQILNSSVQNLRYFTHKTYILYSSIKGVLGHQNKTRNHEKILKAYAKTKIGYIITSESVEEYTIELNTFLLTDIIKDLLQTNREKLTDIFAK